MTSNVYYLNNTSTPIQDLTPENGQEYFEMLTKQAHNEISANTILAILNSVKLHFGAQGLNLFIEWVKQHNDIEEISLKRKSRIIQLYHEISVNKNTISQEFIYAMCLAYRSGDSIYITDLENNFRKNIAPHQMNELQSKGSELITAGLINAGELEILLHLTTTMHKVEQIQLSLFA